jgi:hypothetical protein
MVERSGCLVCGKRLVYSDRHAPKKCVLCGGTFPGHAECSAGHFVCDRCHGLGAGDLVERSCIASDERDPLALALSLMGSPAVNMHGPEHHFLVPAVLLAAYYNSLGEPARKRAKLREARKRAANVLGGVCGFYGDCGAAVGAGIFVSVVTGATCLSKREWRLANLMTARALRTVALHGGPRCCKRNTFLALREAAAFSRRELGGRMRMRRGIRCTFSPMNRECLGKDCPFN